ncbi:MAG: biotin/lipoyl-binding protein, partial [Eubacteriales bacterium]|nr:biotin/lipoyl-binding protein [Eubacteriales bacterium]
MHKIVKRVIIGAVVVALAGTGATAGLLQLRKNNQKEVMVTSVSNLVSDYFMPTTSIDGSVTTSVAQNVSVDSDMIIDQVYVAEGDTVKQGDPLISFDTTLVEMELNIARLKHKKLEQDLNRAVNRLNSLKNGGPILEEDGGGSADNLDNMDVPDDTDDEMASLTGQNNSDTYLAAAVPRLLLSAFVDGELEEEPDADSSGTEDPAQAAVDEALTEPEYQDPSAGDFTSGEEISDGNSGDDITSGQNDVPKPSPTPTPELDENTSYYDPYFTDEMEGVTDGREKF